MAWDPKRPVPEDDGGAHTHTPSQFTVSAAKAGAGGETPEGEWRVLVAMATLVELPAGHRLAYAMTPSEALTLAGTLVQAAGDIESGKVEL